MRRFPIGRIDEGHLIPFLVTDPTEQVNNSSVPVPLRGHKYQHGMTNYLLELHHILHVCFSHSTSSRWTPQMWRTDEGRFRMTPACPSPAPSVVCPLDRICCISKGNPVERKFNQAIWTQDQHFHAGNRCSQCSQYEPFFLPVDHFKHLVTKMVIKV